MQLESGNTISSGIEPVDELMGGLDRGQIYLVHGESHGKSLFGIKFLIEGLKHGENSALVIRYSPEDAVRRFARLGYDCLEDVYSGRLVILEYSDDIVQKIGALRELTPVLRELDWLLGETRPVRLIIDPVASVLAGAAGHLETRAREFAEWARSFGATVVLIANESNPEIIKCFGPLVAESFKFDVREIGDRAARFIRFEKSPQIPDQAIEVDPSRGVFLLGRAYPTEQAGSRQAAPQPPSVAELESIKEELRAARVRPIIEESGPIVDIELTSETSTSVDVTPEAPEETLVSDRAPSATSDNRQTRKLTAIEEREFQAPRSRRATQPTESPAKDVLELQLEEPAGVFAPEPQRDEEQLDDLSYLLDDLTGSSSPLELDLPSLKLQDTPPTQPSKFGVESIEAQPSDSNDARDTTAGERDNEDSKPRSKKQGRASDLKTDSTMSTRVAEVLLHPPAPDSEFASPPGKGARRRAVRETTQPQSATDEEVRPGDFNVLLIEDDSEISELVTQTLGDYSLEVVDDGVTALAKMISVKPDLIVLDFDLPVIDGFKVLSLIRSALNVPIIILSGSRMRAVDRVMASELGADYYLTKPFSAKELKHKARQLIARYRGISSWIVNPSGGLNPAPAARNAEPQAAAAQPDTESFTPYAEFAAEVDKRVKAAIDNGAPFSIVGCRLPQMAIDGGRLAVKLSGLVRGIARDSDLTSTNPRNDLVLLLGDASASGALSFAVRLRARVKDELNQDPALWLRSFPDLEVSSEVSPKDITPVNLTPPGGALNRRATDQAANPHKRMRVMPGDEQPERRSNPRDSYIDFLERL